jgi:tRNA threonylcarbamoyladenosine biosynthesis protein TsaE
LKVNNEQEMINLGYAIGLKLKENMVIALNGDLGAGKTTLTKGIGIALGVKTVVNSPTYTILKVHEGKLMLYHMDVYRIDKSSGDDDLEEFFEMGGVTVIEWSENISYLLPEEYLKIDIKVSGDNNRVLKISSNSSNYFELIESVNI